MKLRSSILFVLLFCITTPAHAFSFLNFCQRSLTSTILIAAGKVTLKKLPHITNDSSPEEIVALISRIHRIPATLENEEFFLDLLNIESGEFPHKKLVFHEYNPEFHSGHSHTYYTLTQSGFIFFKSVYPDRSLTGLKETLLEHLYSILIHRLRLSPPYKGMFKIGEKRHTLAYKEILGAHLLKDIGDYPIHENTTKLALRKPQTARLWVENLRYSLEKLAELGVYNSYDFQALLDPNNGRVYIIDPGAHFKRSSKDVAFANASRIIQKFEKALGLDSTY